MAQYRIQGKAPCVAPTTYIAEEATVIGDVTLAEACSVWPSATIRGDNAPVTIGASTNVQEGAVLHTDPGFPLVIGDGVTVGHQAMLHGCTIGAGSLIGMGATILNGAKIGKGCLIGAGALITEGKEIPDGALVMGAPGKVIRLLDAEAQARLLRSAEHYRANAARYRDGLRAL